MSVTENVPVYSHGKKTECLSLENTNFLCHVKGYVVSNICFGYNTFVYIKTNMH